MNYLSNRRNKIKFLKEEVDIKKLVYLKVNYIRKYFISFSL
jgi:hypothetical protein